jgi:nucleotide-binding universal stress UspA family protein
VPVDGAPSGEHALPLAAALARRAGAALRVVHAFSAREEVGESLRLVTVEEWLARRRQERRAYLDRLARRLKRAHPVELSAGLLESDDAAAALCEASGGADLVVMATRGGGAWGRLWRGSVAADVARGARCPVLLTRGRDDAPDLTDARPPQNVLIPLDGSERSEEALDSAAALGSHPRTCYTLLHVIRGRALTDRAIDPHASMTPLPGELTVAEARHYLQGVAGKLADRGIAARTGVLIGDRPVAEAITGYAERSGADLIAMTTRGRGALSRLLRASLADEVVRRSGVPVLLRRPPDPAVAPARNR